MSDNEEQGSECVSPRHNFNSRWQELFRSSGKDRSDFLKKVLNKVDESLFIGVVRLLIPLFKLITTLVIFLGVDTSCPAELALEKWFVFVILNDFLAVILKSLALKTKIDMERVRRSSSTVIDLLHMDGNTDYENIIGASTNHDGSKSNKYMKKIKVQKLLTVLWRLKVVFHLGIIIYGNILYHNLAPCPDQASPRPILTLTHLIIGYLYIGIPTLFVILTFLWFTGSRLVLSKCFKKLFRKKEARPSSVKLSKLKTEKFTGNIEGYPECSICSKEYVKGEKITRLECDTTHHFHKSCLKTEIKKSDSCPLCGVDIIFGKSNILKGLNSEPITASRVL